MINTNKFYEYIVRGFYPDLYDNLELDSSSFYADYVSTYIERNVSDFINLKDKHNFMNLMAILASLTGQEMIYESFAKEIGADKKQSNLGLVYSSLAILFIC